MENDAIGRELDAICRSIFKTRPRPSAEEFTRRVFEAVDASDNRDALRGCMVDRAIKDVVEEALRERKQKAH